ncbi:MAG: pyridoxamine 5'-phosphate oxidase family protein [Thermoflexales bacterium]|nr:pyridoxamine 5'-phosphate oxidase family protein [Thermoflexales bacterium]MDW8350908.1 pyridoxamine 5'-phosphate oxidase family protein [Anaerolineae bacterium]
MNKGEDLPEDRLFAARNIWLATVRPDGRPHLVPVWFVWVRERFYVCTAGQSVKAKNLIANPRASAALEDGDRPVIAEGRATILTQPYPDDVAAEFKRKYGWDIATDDGYDVLIEIVPERWPMRHR